jgi:Flp pilus assembly protein CpaB
MMNAKALLPLIAGLGIGGLALVLGINTLKSSRAAQAPAPRLNVWAVKEDVPRGTELRADMLVALAYPTDLVPQGAFKKQEDLVGRVPRNVAPAGVPILETMLAPAGTKPGIFVKPGFRAIAVKIDAGSGVDYHLEPGCFVDVVGSFKVRRNGRTETIARTVVENAEVAAVGQRLSPARNDDEDGKKEKDKSQTVRAVTLFVKPELVPKLLLTEQEGRIKLSLRGTTDGQELNDEKFVSDADLMGEPSEEKSGQGNGQSAAAALGLLKGLFTKPAAPATPPDPALAAAPPPPALERWILKIYRGTQEETLKFKSADSSERVDDSDEPAAGRPGPDAVAPPPVDLNPVREPDQPGDAPEPEELAG